MNKVLIGISGGVDSSVAAILLKNEGYELVGANMKLYESSDSEARDVCNKIGIPYIELDYRSEFKKCVINNFIEEYKSARTPNPCIECNRCMKFGYLYDYIKNNNIDYIATGHYAKVEYSDKYLRYVLKKANNILKDQSYFLYVIKKDILPHILFPLANFNSKDEIRKIAKENNLNTASKSDSQDICFIKDDYKIFLENNSNIKAKKGNIIYKDKVLGTHDGLYKYTIGQRKGLGISYSEPLYVINLDLNKNEVVVGTIDDLYTKSFKVINYNLLLFDKIDKELKVNVKTRYRSKEYPATIIERDGFIDVILDDKVKGVTKGQSAVFYIDDIVVGGGIIS